MLYPAELRGLGNRFSRPNPQTQSSGRGLREIAPRLNAELIAGPLGGAADFAVRLMS